MSKKLARVISLLLVSALPAFPQTSAQGSTQDQSGKNAIKAKSGAQETGEELAASLNNSRF